jgi:hypothetical protein
LALAAVLVVDAGVEPASAKTKVFSSGPINRPIPDPVGGLGAEIAPNIKVLAKGRVLDVNVAVRISHPVARQLDLGASHIPSGGVFRGAILKEHGTLAAPQGADFGGGAPGCRGASFTVFDSKAPTSILEGVPPFAGTYSPLTPLSVFNRTQLRGRWYLDLLDTEPGGAGTVDCWQLKIRYKPAKKRGLGRGKG